MNRSLITENRNLRNKVARLEKENESLREQYNENCREDLIEQVRKKFNVPKWLLSERSYEVLQSKTFQEIEEFMARRARMIRGDKPRIVQQEEAR